MNKPTIQEMREQLVDNKLEELISEISNKSIIPNEYLKRKKEHYFNSLTDEEFIKYEKLECIHVALQELQNRYSIPDDDCDLEDAFKFTEDLKEPYLERFVDD